MDVFIYCEDPCITYLVYGDTTQRHHKEDRYIQLQATAIYGISLMNNCEDSYIIYDTTQRHRKGGQCIQLQATAIYGISLIYRRIYPTKLRGPILLSIIYYG